jgi:hypothetical protein
MVSQGILRFRNFAIVSALLWVVFLAPGLAAQVRGVTARPSGINRPLNIPPTVGSISNHVPPYLPNPPASVTSISPLNFNTPRFNNNFGRGFNGRRVNGCRGCGYGGYGYAAPYSYIYPAYDPGYDTSGDGGPYLYSGPPGPQTPPEQTLHVVVDAPAKHAVSDQEMADEQPMPAPQRAIPDAKPGVPTTLVYRDGRKQVVTNYAIMGQTLYVFDDHAKKISLADLDVPATVKVNDDEGVEFQLPKTKQNAKPSKTSGVPQQSAPDNSQKPQSSVSSSTP